MRLTIFLFLITAFFFACDKSDVQSNNTGMYTSRQFKITSSPKMYTQNGEVTDRAFVDRYLNALPAGSNYFYRNIDTVIHPGNDSARFITTDTASIKIFTQWEKRVVKPHENYLYLYPLDTTRFLSNSSTHPFDEAVSKMGTYRPYLKKTCFGNGTSCITSSYEAAIGQWQSGKLSFPLMSYSLIHNDATGSTYGTGREKYNNLFNPSVVALLRDKDTLLVQTFELLFEKVQ